MNSANRLTRLIALPVARAAAEPIHHTYNGPAVTGRVATVDIASVWRNALITLAARAPHVLPLALALAGLHMALVLAGLVYAPDQPSLAWRIAEGLVQAVGCGALTWIGMHGTRTAPITGRRLYRALGARWPALLPGALLCGTLLTV